MSISYPRCKCCKGLKKIIGLGMIAKECPYCLGLGYVKPEDEDGAIVKTFKSRKAPDKEKAVAK